MAPQQYTLTEQHEPSSPSDVTIDDPPEEARSEIELDMEKGQSSMIASQWTIGWMTPSAIITCYLLAVCLASAHLGLFRWLDRREVAQTIKQPYVTALSVVFVNGFRTLLAAALSMSFIQILWKDLRVRPMRIGDLDSFLSVLTNPLYLGRLRLLGAAPLPFLCALLAWCIPIAMIFPPGALTVEAKLQRVLANQSVPTFDPSYMGNGSFVSMMDEALWQPDDFDAYSGPTNRLTRVARQSVMAGDYLPSSSPCSENCSYTIEIPSPRFACTNTDAPDLYAWVNKTYPQSPTWANAYLYLASPDSSARTNSTQYTFDFALRWKDSTTGEEYQNLTCRAHEAVYTVHLNYTGGVQQATVTAVTTDGGALNSSGLYDDFAIVPASYDRVSVINATTTGTTGQNVTELNRRANLAAVQDTLVLGLRGYIDIFVLHSQPTANTLIALTSLYSGPAKQPVFTLTPASLQSMLQNITLSLLTLNQTTTTTTVTKTITVNVYRFPHPARLITPYFVALAMALTFLGWGGHALVRNGISASTTGLFQTLCTTRGSERLDDLAMRGCLGGRENVPDELRELKVMFGEMRTKDGSRVAGLGAAEEVMPLIKGGL
ncbi:uncharacterized protein BO97DRAFT_387983 [Aspergillus homomorphus CBS 101889]|uniref:Uncharacterized protein n=1 Tax=Aspergillus homomorphus (strain CBS 101889) TaxID=1450537 RepID=A0A395I436_ASPHC|nr:hypothetical protein BO97DRAFT_387983 [Aspergillus homomorphus CBS 101889]RAL13948.1 hypothetical protein BO97DRAFT_387983 [Aspergillus homomorphus CBS 101889]